MTGCAGPLPRVHSDFTNTAAVRHVAVGHSRRLSCNFSNILFQETPAVSAEIIAALHAIVGDAGLKTGDTDTESFLTDWHGQYRGRSLAVVMPEDRKSVV